MKFPLIVAVATLLIPALQAANDSGIPITDPLVVAKCGSCHAADAKGNLDRISYERTTPEGWQEALKKMVRDGRVSLTPGSISPDEARSIVQYLATTHGLAPAESRAVAHYAERRVHEEEGEVDESLTACLKCHPASRPLAWRRTAADWKQLAASHLAIYKTAFSDEALNYLSAAAPLHTAAWDAWSAHAHADPAGRWLVSAYLPGRGAYTGELIAEPGANPGDLNTRVTLHSVRDGSLLSQKALSRTGQVLVYGASEWRGRSHSAATASTPDDPASEFREVLTIDDSGQTATGRWFWGQYQEFGFDVQLRRPASTPTLLALDHTALKAGAPAIKLRLIGDNLPASLKPADIDLGPGIAVRRIVSNSPTEITFEADAAPTATPGKRDVKLGASALPAALAVYDRIDYIKVTPESSLAAFGARNAAKGYQQFEAIAYQRGPDGKLHTADDVELGPVDATWSFEVFYSTDASHNDQIGKVTPQGLFVPAEPGPGDNHDVWVIATSPTEKDAKGEPLNAKGYLVVTVPYYTLNGRRYIRDLNRWIVEGSW